MNDLTSRVIKGFTIENNVDVPRIRPGRIKRFPLVDIEVGESFLVPVDVASRMIIDGAVQYFKRTDSTRKFTVRKDVGGCRVFRIE